jgi:O-methyltransferase
MGELSRRIRSIVKDVSMRTGVYDRTFFQMYPYSFEPNQLVTLAESVRVVADVPGCIVEVGCLHGATTVFLNKYLTGSGIGARPYYAIDTFSGFTRAHASFEVHERGKAESISDYFQENKKAWFDKTMSIHGLSCVQSVKSDVTTFDFTSIAPIAFCLLDVDLYKPTIESLPRIYACMSSGGIIVVDDCKSQEMWDGAWQAYTEFVRDKGIPSEIVNGKLGIIRIGLQR